MLPLVITEQDEINNTHGSRAPLGLGVNYILMSIALLMVGCRMLVKGKLGKLGIEDALILISMVRSPPPPHTLLSFHSSRNAVLTTVLHSPVS